MSTSNRYSAVCQICGEMVPAESGVIRRYGGASKHAAPAGATTAAYTSVRYVVRHELCDSKATKGHR